MDALVPREAEALRREAAEGRLAVGRVLLAIDEPAVPVHDDIAAVEVVAEVDLHGRGRLARLGGADPDTATRLRSSMTWMWSFAPPRHRLCSNRSLTEWVTSTWPPWRRTSLFTRIPAES